MTKPTTLGELLGAWDENGRIHNTLLNAGVHSVRDLVAMKKSDLLQKRGIGVKTADFVERCLRKHGLRFNE